MINDAKMAVLRERGARKGFVTIDDLREALPIDQMNADEIALVVVHLEEAGVSVELDDDLMGVSRRRGATAPGAPSLSLPGAPRPRRDPTQPAPAPGIAQDAYRASEPINETPPASSSAWLFVAAAAAVIALGALILFVLSR